MSKDNITSGASSDIQQATKMAKAMVTQLGYSDQLGTVAYGDNQEEVFLGMSMGRQQSISEATAQKIDAEVRRLVEEGYETARRILTEKKVDFETLAKALLEFETLSGDEIPGRPQNLGGATLNTSPRKTGPPSKKGYA
ncbi:hypothetical protein [Pseudomonas aeruginosa]|uniref:hypothetical protein n=1 Tax=Pseudomonas aeruginosa TaxID=287 RepID=UPI0028127499|nr:hypothetical protein [Pseudomonas aeruginosa]